MDLDTFRLIHKLFRKHLTDDLRRAPWKGNINPLAGHCYVASEAAYHLLGGKAAGWKPYHMKVRGVSHWFIERHLKGCRPERIDITAKQFEGPMDYSSSRGKGFLTKAPSKRAIVLMQRIMSDAESCLLTASC